MSQTKAQLLDGSVVSVAFSAGSAATPSLYFAGDLNTGIYSPGADQVAVATNGTGRLFISNGGAVLPSGNLLVGQDTNPSAYTFIANTGSGANNNAAAFTNNADASLDIRLTSGVSLVNAGTGTLALGTSNTERLRITSAGLVGIGTSSPGEKLTVAGNISSSAAQPYISLIDSNWSAGTVIRSGVNTLGTATGDYQLFNVPTGKGFAFAQNNATNSLVIDTAGLVGIGTTSPAQALSVVGNIIADGSAASQYVASSKAGVTTTYLITDANGGNIQTDGAWPIRFTTNSSERARIDSSGRLLVGTSTARSNFFDGASSVALQLEGNSTGTASLSITRNDATADGNALILAKARSTAYAVLQYVDGTTSDDRIGRISFQGADGTNMVPAANIEAFVDGTPGANDMPGRLVFSTTADGAASPTERMRITSAGNVGIGTSSPGQSLSIVSPSTAQAIGIWNRASDNIYSGIYFKTSDGATDQSSILNERAGTNGASLLFYTKADGGSTTERARIDSSGRLLVGTSSARTAAAYGAAGFQVESTYFANSSISAINNQATSDGSALILGKSRGTSNGSTTIVQAGDTTGYISFQGTDGTALLATAAIFSQVDGTPAANDMPGRLEFWTTPDGASSPTERMRIDSAGALKASTNGTYKFGTGVGEITHNDATSTVHLTASSTGFTGDAVTISTYRNTVNDSYKFLACIRQGSAVALEIRDDGDVYNVNGTYGSISDVKLKENIVDANSQWDDIRQLRVRNYNFKPETNNSTHKQIGVIAQEIEDVSPGLVNTVPDRDEDGNDLGTVTKSVNYSVLYMKAVKALQEAMERIETLEAKVAALETA